MQLDDFDLTCPKCNGRMELNEDQTEATCAYCGYHALTEKEETIEEHAERMEALSYARHKGIQRAQDEAAKEAKKAHTRKKFRVIGGVILFFVVCYVIGYFSRPVVDPFEAIDVEFVGTSGNGYGDVIVHAPTSGTYDPYDIDYELSQSWGLAEGDKVTVSASSSSYRLNPSSKIYMVEGLRIPLSNIDDIDDRTLDLIHAKSERTLEQCASGTASHAELASLEPAALYLFTDGRNGNTFYDVYKATFNIDNGTTSVRYLVAYYDNLMVENAESESETPLVDYENSMYIGDIIEIADTSADDYTYSGYITGYKNLDDVRTDLQIRQSSTMHMQEKLL